MPRAKIRDEGSEKPEPHYPRESRVDAALGAMLEAFKADLDDILSEAKEYARGAERALDGVTLLTKAEAAKRMKISIASLDRRVTNGEIEATYLDRRVRFKLSEIQRFIDLRTGALHRKRRR